MTSDATMDLSDQLIARELRGRIRNLDMQISNMFNRGIPLAGAGESDGSCTCAAEISALKERVSVLESAMTTVTNLCASIEEEIEELRKGAEGGNYIIDGGNSAVLLAAMRKMLKAMRPPEQVA